MTPQGQKLKHFLEGPGDRAPRTQERHWQMQLWAIYPKGFVFYHFFSFRVVNKRSSENKYMCINNQLLPAGFLH